MAKDNGVEKVREKAEALYSDLVTRSTELEKRLIKINDHFKDAKIENREFQKTWDSLKEIFKSADALISNFKTDKTAITALLKQTQTFYDNRFLPLRERITDPDNGLNNTLQFSKNSKKEIEKIGLYCEKQYKLIADNVKIHTSSLKTLVTLEAKIKKIFAEVTTHGEKSKTWADEIASAKKLSEKAKLDIEASRKKCGELESEIQEIQTKASSFIDEIENFRSRSQKTFSDILEIYEVAADTGRSGEFDRRRKALALELQKWDRNLFWGSIILLGFILLVFWYQLFLYGYHIKDLDHDVNFYFRFLLASPIIFYMTFCTGQYNRVRKLIDQYTFKTTLAVSLKSHLEMLNKEDKFSQPEHINDILKFSITALEGIYKEPYSDENMKLNLKLKALELSLEKKKETVAKIESLESRIDDIVLKIPTS